LATDSSLLAAPIVVGERAVMRCGNVVACVDVRNGNLRWQRAIEAEDLESKSLAVTSEAVITASSDPDEPILLALDIVTGSDLWQVVLSEQVLQTGMAACDEGVWVITTDDADRAFTLREFDVHTGSVRRTVEGPAGANYPIVKDKRLFFTSRARTSAGIWVLETEKTAALHLISADAAGAPAVTADIVTASIRRGNNYEVVCLSMSAKEELWSQPSVEYAVAADANQIAMVESVPVASRTLVLREALSGEIVWSTEPLENMPLFLFFSGDAIGAIEDQGLLLLDRQSGAQVSHIGADWGFSWGGGLADGRLILGDGSDVICYASERG
jgi:outer membrane protein assembly factor BamB